MITKTINPHRAGGSVDWHEGGPCSECGTVAASGYYDVAVHDCRSDEWVHVVMTLPDDIWQSLPPNHRVLWPEDRVAGRT